MSGKDLSSAERPHENRWMQDKAKEDGPRHDRSATVDRLARDLGVEPEELAKKYPADTLRRLKYPVRVTVEPDGTRRYDTVVVVAEGPTALVRR